MIKKRKFTRKATETFPVPLMLYHNHQRGCCENGYWMLFIIHQQPRAARHFCLYVHFFSKVLFFVLSHSPSVSSTANIQFGHFSWTGSRTKPATPLGNWSCFILYVPFNGGPSSTHTNTHMVNDKRYMLRVWDNSCCPLAGCPVYMYWTGGLSSS